MHAYCLELLKDHLKPGAKALDVGFGSGYLTVAMSKMMDDKGTAVGIEHIKELCDFANWNISKGHKNLLDTKKVILVHGDGRNGYAEYGPYNCIHVGAAAAQLPQALIDQLANGGRLVIPATTGTKNATENIKIPTKQPIIVAEDFLKNSSVSFLPSSV